MNSNRTIARIAISLLVILLVAALAGLWIEVLAYADSREEDKARALFPDLVSKDPKISSEAQAEETMRKTLQRLMDVRAEYNLPRVCG